MARRCTILLLLGLVALPFTAARTLACMCGFGNVGKTMREVAASYSEGANSSKIVFEGLVEKQEIKTGAAGAPGGALSMTMRGQYRAVSIRVLRVYRGEASGSVTVLTGVGFGDCGFDFDTGERYLVYADKKKSGALFTSICSGTSSLEHAGPALRFLRGEKPNADDLLDSQTYQDKVESGWYGTACGHVIKADGSPLSDATVDATQIREEALPPATSSDPNLTKADGSFCIPSIVPGKYLLTAEKFDYDDGIRWMGFYPGVRTHAAAVPIEIKEGESLSNLRFSVAEEHVYTVSFRIVSADGTPLPPGNLGVMIESPDQDALAYHLAQTEKKNGAYYAGYVPPGHYVVQTFVLPDFQTGKIPSELSKWGMAKQEVDISSNAEIILRLNPVEQR